MHCHENENAAYLKFKLNQFSVFATAVKKWKRCTNNQQKEVQIVFCQVNSQDFLARFSPQQGDQMSF
jgi:hypothetical protein